MAVLRQIDDDSNQLKNHICNAHWFWRLGGILIASGLLHIAVWLIEGEPWTGPLSWRKPILFGISTGLTMLSVGWLLTKLRSSKYDVWASRIVSVSLFVEVALITIQTWRGEASHFNHSNAFNWSIDLTITVLITVAAIYLFDLTRRTFGFVAGTSDMVLAVRAGMVFLAVSCLLGFVVLIYGSFRQSIGKDPATLGGAGVVKFPHGITIHAIQILPACCWTFGMFGMKEQQRRRCIIYIIISLSALLSYSILQTACGKARFDLSPLSGAILGFSVVILAPALFHFVTALVGPHKQDVNAEPNR